MNHSPPNNKKNTGTGLTSSTTEVVGDVRRKKDENPEWYLGLQTQYDKVYERGLEAILTANYPEIGVCCDENQALLKELGVSCKELEDLIEVAKNAGAVGSKLAGTGRGGLMFAICDSPESQERVFVELSKASKQCWKTTFQ